MEKEELLLNTIHDDENRVKDVKYTLTAEVDGVTVFKSEHYAIDMLEEDLLDCEQAVATQIEIDTLLDKYARSGNEDFYN